MPPVVCLCGSTRFKSRFEEANAELTLLGNIVLSVGFFGRPQQGPAAASLTPEVKRLLDVLHLRKIDMADRVHVLNVDGYLGISTKREAWYAWQTGKPLSFDVPVTVEQVRGYFGGWRDWEAAGEEASR